MAVRRPPGATSHSWPAYPRRQPRLRAPGSLALALGRRLFVMYTRRGTLRRLIRETQETDSRALVGIILPNASSGHPRALRGPQTGASPIVAQEASSATWVAQCSGNH